MRAGFAGNCKAKVDASHPIYSAPLFRVRLVSRSELRFNDTLLVNNAVQLDSVSYDDDATALKKQCAPERPFRQPSSRGLETRVRDMGHPLRTPKRSKWNRRSRSRHLTATGLRPTRCHQMSRPYSAGLNRNLLSWLRRLRQWLISPA
jgi:hypothetical protein